MNSLALIEEIQAAIKSDKAIIGYKESIKFIKLNQPKLIVIANNLPDSMREEIKHSAEISKIKLEVFNSNSKDLGIACGKPFPVSTLVIKG